MLNKSLLGYLAILGEVGADADPGMVSDDPNDSGGKSYGLYQLASAPGSVQAFVIWLNDQCRSYAERLAAAGDPTCDQNFVAVWQQIAANDPVGFSRLQDAYVAAEYYAPASDVLLSKYDFDIVGHSLPLKQVLFANAVQHGPSYGAEAFSGGAGSVGCQLGDMSDADIITALYNNKINDLSWSSGAPGDRPGLFARWENERDTALALLG